MNGTGDAATGGGGGAGLRRCDHEASPDKTILNRIMLRYRPIAPKPTGGSSGKAAEAGNGFVGVGRRKRRYVRVSGAKRSGNCSRRERSPSGGRSEEEEEVKTLRLLPDESAKEEPDQGREPGPLDLEKGEIQRPRMGADVAGGESWVTVLSLTTNACMDRGLGYTDEERWTNLEADTCPGFISDGYYNHRVVWSNTAYRRMVVGEDAAEAKVAVNLAVVEAVRLPVTCPAFACMVRLQYTWRVGSFKTAVVPCDVWRMNAGGFAWRLDLKAGLTLGIGV